MTGRHAGDATLGFATLAAAVVVVVHGPLTMLACAAGGALVAAWLHVYARVLCARQSLAWDRVVRRARDGAGGGPVLMVGDMLAESVVWPVTSAGVAVWLAAVTPSGRVRLPAELQRSIARRRGG